MVKSEVQFTFPKKKRVTGNKRVDAIFEHGKSFISYPLRVVFLQHEQSTESGCSILVSVPKKRIKQAAHRNRIKRLIRESYRLNKELINHLTINQNSIDVALIYVKDSVTDFAEIDKAIKKAINKIEARIQKNEEGE